MKAVILAGGEGTRLYPITEKMPKPMIPLMGKPILEHLLIQAKNVGITDFCIVIGNTHNSIAEYFDDGKNWEVNIKYVQQAEPKGVVDAITKAEDFIKDEDYFLVFYSDVILCSEFIQRVLNTHNELRCSAIVGVTIVNNPEYYGVAELDSDSRILQIVEKPKEKPISNYALAGIYLFSKEAYEIIKNEPQLDAALKKIIEKNGDVYGVIWEKDWVEITWPWDLLSANKLLLKQASKECRGTYISGTANVSERANIENFVVIDDSAIIRAGAQITGPVYIGRNSYIGNNSLIRDYTSISENVTVGFSVEIKNSIVLPNAFIGQLSYIGDSLIGTSVRISSGFQTWNKPFEKEILYEWQNVKIRIPRKKFGAVIGSNTQIGMNVVTFPGISIGCNCRIYPGVVLNKNVKSNKVIKRKK
ncbi:MAG: bifunctional sugar-1-phosphate nucleotidylyltransferase/acetyltransferase [Candidatus Asgardarchaeum sp.]